MITDLGDTQGLTLLLVGGLSLAVVLAVKRWAPLVPGSLLVVLLGTAASVLFDLQACGVASWARSIPACRLSDFLTSAACSTIST